MSTFESFQRLLYTVNDSTFEDIALRVFQFQAANNPVYAEYLLNLGVDVKQIASIGEIPFLPISFFKNQKIKTGSWETGVTFTSSGTTGQRTSYHAVPSLAYYLENCRKTFEIFFGKLDQYHLLALLPSYLEREGSSLIAMARYFMEESKSPHAGFYLNDQEKLIRKLEDLKRESAKTLLLGVSFALLDLAERYQADLSHCMIMETGGMKGRRKEIIRQELHSKIRDRFNVKVIFSEYGMTELMSQAYSSGNGEFNVPPWMRILVRELNDPFKQAEAGKVGGINVIDLANLYSCVFIETQDLGRLSQKGYFEVLGRIDNSDLRGCNLLAG